MTARQLVVAAALLTASLAHAAAPGEKLDRPFTVLFVGGSGGDGLTPTLAQLRERLGSLEPKRAVVVFTGNYSEAELPRAEEEGRARAEKEIFAHVTATADFVKRGGRVYFLAGHQDFAAGGTKAVRRLRKFLNQSFQAAAGDADSDDAIDVMPHAGCGDPIDLELTDTLALVLLNSQWWMQDWANDPQSNEGCDLKTRLAFRLEVQGAFSGHRTRRLIVASHHPLASYGERGGSFSARAHLSPAPLLGTLSVLARQAGLVPQYQNHPMVRSYVEVLFDEAQRYGGFVFASGHDSNLQFLKVDKQTQLISGTSAREAGPTSGIGEGHFAAASPGWAELVVEPSGAGEARYFSAAGAPLFTTRLPDLKSFGASDGAPPPVPPGPVTATYTKEPMWQPGPVPRFFIGSFYSNAYGLEQPYPTLDLKVAEGGLTPFKTGGGLQTNALRLHDPKGGDWALRATTKDSSRALPYPFNQLTFVNRLIDHGFAATHPEAALAVPRLARALGLLAPDPRLYYLPDQEGLGKYRGYITDEVVMLERRPNEPEVGVLPASLAGFPSPEGETHFRSVDETLEKMREKPWKHHLDQEAMLRARLLDLFVGDWDRHRGQWTFAVTPNTDGSKTYTPVPRDRDQAMSNYDGLGLFLARIGTPMARNLQPFRADYGSVGWLTYSGRDIDPVLLNRLPRDRWLKIAAEAKAALTDAVIDEAFSGWHPAAYQLDGANLAAWLKVRRDSLVEVADEFYRLLNRNVDVVGSAHDDTFELWFADSGTVRVSVRAAGKHAGTPPYFDRVFDPAHTAELRLYGLEGDDTLLVHGAAHRQLEIRFVGGVGQDTVSADSGTAAAPIDARAIRLYDAEEGARINPGVLVRDERSRLAYLNQYDRAENHDPDYGSFIPGFLINPDDGLYLGGKFTYIVAGYKKTPFAARHDVNAHFATATLGASVDYLGLYPQSVELLDQQLELSLKTPTYTRNFFGYTNRRVDDGAPIDFYRVRQARYEGRYGLSYGFGGDRTRVGAQLLGQAIVTEATPGRFVTVSPEVSPGTLGPRYFAGGRLYAETNTFDNLGFPRRGVALQLSVEGRYDLGLGRDFSTNTRAAASTAFALDRHQRFVILTRASLEGIVGPHRFYFAPTLGDRELRAYAKQQLAGELAFAHTTDLRIDVIRIYSGVPSTIGLNLSVDHGRVFGAGIPGHDYHLNYGGGVWWFLLDAIGVSVNYHRGLDGASRFSLALGPIFGQTGFSL